MVLACSDKQNTSNQANQTSVIQASNEPTPPPLSMRTADNRPLAKFEPPENGRLLFIGNNLEDLGGIEDYKNGYLNHFPTPSGIATNIKIRTGDREFGYLHGPLSGLSQTADWGTGPHNMSKYMAEYDLINCAISLGIDFAGHGSKIMSGYYDEHLTQLATWLGGLGERPIFLRIGYEFDNPSSLYVKENFIPAFRYIRDYIEKTQPGNIAYVWHARGSNLTKEELEQWYPGDDAVDWCGFSYYMPRDLFREINFVLAHKKPLMIASSAPVLTPAGNSQRAIMANPEDGLLARTRWFTPLFRMMQSYPDVIKAFTYVHSDWQKYGANRYIPQFEQADSRLFINPSVRDTWKRELARPNYLKPTDDLWHILTKEPGVQ